MSSDVAKIREPATAANNLLKKLVTPDDDLEVAQDGWMDFIFPANHY